MNVLTFDPDREAISKFKQKFFLGSASYKQHSLKFPRWADNGSRSSASLITDQSEAVLKIFEIFQHLKFED